MTDRDRPFAGERAERSQKKPKAKPKKTPVKRIVISNVALVNHEGLFVTLKNRKTGELTLSPKRDSSAMFKLWIYRKKTFRIQAANGKFLRAHGNGHITATRKFAFDRGTGFRASFHGKSIAFYTTATKSFVRSGNKHDDPRKFTCTSPKNTKICRFMPVGKTSARIKSGFNLARGVGAVGLALLPTIIEATRAVEKEIYRAGKGFYDYVDRKAKEISEKEKREREALKQELMNRPPPKEVVCFAEPTRAECLQERPKH